MLDWVLNTPPGKHWKNENFSTKQVKLSHIQSNYSEIGFTCKYEATSNKALSILNQSETTLDVPSAWNEKWITLP